MYDGGHPNPVLWDNQKWQGEEGDGRGVQEAEDKSIPMADSYWCMVKTIRMLWLSYN